jgi:O-antigen ligase
MERPGWESLQKIERVLWGATLVALPVTSFRYLPFMGADTQVRPLSLLPAALLFISLAIRSIRERHLILWNGNFQPVLLFILIAAAASAAGFFLAPADLFSFSYSGRVLRAWLSFGVGIIFLVTSMAMNQDEPDLRFTLKWLYIGLIANVAWSLVQSLEIYVFQTNIVDSIQRKMMMAGLPPNNRISGLALEPSWLAAQVITLYLPWTFAGVIKYYNWNKWRWIPVIILVACAYLLLFSFSRSGILTAVGVVVLTFLIAGWESLRKMWGWFFSPLKLKSNHPKNPLQMIFRLVTIAALFVSLAGGIFILSKNQYFSRIWQSRETTLTDYFVDIYAGPRLAYSWAGWMIFEQHPLTGVGLGAAGFYFYDALPDWARFKNPEISKLLSPAHQAFPNIKNLYARLLSETGILGFWAFISFYLLAFGKILTLLHSKRKELTFLGTASLMGWLSIVILGFTQDSLAMPIIWIPLGILIGIKLPVDSNIWLARSDNKMAK